MVSVIVADPEMLDFAAAFVFENLQCKRKFNRKLLELVKLQLHDIVLHK